MKPMPMIPYVVAVAVIVLRLQAAEYFVDGNNPSSNDGNVGSEALPWRTISKANQVLRPGDTVFIKAGTYGTFIAPLNTGSVSGRITYKAFGNGTVTVRDTTRAVVLAQKSYITVTGIKFFNLDSFLTIDGGSYNVISDCVFDQ